MTFEELSASLAGDAPPPGMPPAVCALWRDAKGDWAGAHEIAQDIGTPAGSIIHAYLHRKEGDLGNAQYWYRHARRAPATGPLADEWKALVEELLRASP